MGVGVRLMKLGVSLIGLGVSMAIQSPGTYLNPLPCLHALRNLLKVFFATPARVALCCAAAAVVACLLPIIVLCDCQNPQPGTSCQNGSVLVLMHPSATAGAPPEAWDWNGSMPEAGLEPTLFAARSWVYLLPQLSLTAAVLELLGSSFGVQN